jgi:hypothetical protein
MRAGAELGVGDDGISDRQKACLVCIAAGLAAAMAMHFLATALFVAPLNPIKLEWGDEIACYMTPYFEQNWSLFAPNPISEERGMLVRARVTDVDGTIRTTPFADITNPAIEAVHGNRVFPSRHARLVSSGIQMLSWEDPVIERYRQTLRKRQEAQLEQPPPERAAGPTPAEPSPDGTSPVEPPLTPPEQRYRARTERFLQTLASAESVRRWGPEVVAVQVRLVRHEFPRFSERRSERTGLVTYEDLVWMPRVAAAR